MTAHYIAKIVQREYDKLDIDAMLAEFKGIEKYKYGRLSDEWVNKDIENKQYHRWIHACYLLKSYLEKHFETFVETELVYKWAKPICESKNKFLNKNRLLFF